MQGAIADTMGLGKTIQVIMASRALFQQGKVKSVLIVCPKSVVYNWEREYEKWSPELHSITVYGSVAEREAMWRRNKHVYITTYESYKNDCQGESIPPGRESFDLVVIDECQRIKNRHTARSILIKSIPCKKRWALSGTPVENKIEDLVSIFGFIYPGLLKDHLGESRIKTLIKPYFLRRKAEDVIDQFPELISITDEVDLTVRQREEHSRYYDEQRKVLKRLGDSATRDHVFAAIQKLKQICNFDPKTKDSSKIELLLDRLEDAQTNNKKSLIFSWFKEFGVNDILPKIKKKYNVLTITGDTPEPERQKNIKKFMNDGMEYSILLATLGSMREGANLQRASYVFHFDHWWNPAVHDQATGRARRIGGEAKVFEYHFWTKNTIEGKIRKILERKLELFARVIDDESKITVSSFSDEELFGLFDLDAPTTKRKKTSDDFDRMLPEDFEKSVLRIFENFGYKASLTKASSDGGIDINLSRPSFGKVEKSIVQCKRYSNTIGVKAIREFMGVILADRSIAKGYFVTSSNFSKQAVELAEDSGQIELIDGIRLKELATYGSDSG
jgi:SNF2 family DNA or RNA helicase